MVIARDRLATSLISLVAVGWNKKTQKSDDRKDERDGQGRRHLSSDA